MNYKTLIYRKEQDIVTLSLNNTPANIMDMVFFDELADVCRNIIAKEQYSGVIIQSEGRHFSAGASIKALLDVVHAEPNSDLPAQMKRNLEAFRILRNLSKPSVSILKGVCYGSAFELALTSRYRIAAPGTLLCLPECSFGLMPGLGGIQSLSARVGKAKTMEWVLSSTSINASQALGLGVIDEILPKNHLRDRAESLIYSKT